MERMSQGLLLTVKAEWEAALRDRAWALADHDDLSAEYCDGLADGLAQVVWLATGKQIQEV